MVVTFPPSQMYLGYLIISNDITLTGFLFSSQDLVRQMLDVEPSKRPSATNILTHPWMTSANPPNTQLVVTREAHYIKVTFINRLILLAFTEWSYL